MYRSSSRGQEWNVSVLVPTRLPKYVQARSAQYRLKKFGGPLLASAMSGKPTAIVQPLSSATSFATSSTAAASGSEEYVKRGHQKYQWSEQYLKDMSRLSKIVEYEDEVPPIVWNPKTAEMIEEESLRMKINRLQHEMRQLDTQFRQQTATLNSTHNELVRTATQIEALEKDKKFLQELFGKSKDDHFAAELQLSSIIKTNSHNEQLVDSLNIELENEKLSKTSLERVNKRLENELKISSETIAFTETTIKEIHKSLKIKEEELVVIANKLEDKELSIRSLQEEINALKEKIKSLEVQYSKEHQSRLNLEQIESSLRRELENLASKFEQFMTDYTVQLERANQKESELNRIKQDLTKIIDERDESLKILKEKFAEQILILNESLTVLRLEKQRLEKIVAEFKSKIEVVAAELESVIKEKQSMEIKKNRAEMKAFEFELKIEQQNGLMSELTGQKARLATEIQSLTSQLSAANSSINFLQSDKNKLIRETSLLGASLDESNAELSAKRSQVIELTTELNSLNNKLDELERSNEDLRRKLTRTNEDIQNLNAKLQEANLTRIHDLEEQKKQFEVKIALKIEENATLSDRINTLENVKSHMMKEITDLQDSLDTVNSRVHILDNKVKAYENSLEILSETYGETVEELKATSDENRKLTAMTFKLQTYLDESSEDIANLHRENEKIRGEIHNLNVELLQLSEKVREAENHRKRLLDENYHINKNLAESETLIAEKSESISKLKIEIDNFNVILEQKIQEKVLEFETIKKSLKITIKGLRTNLEAEIANRIEAVKRQKLFEERVSELETSLHESNIYRAEAMDNIRKLQQDNRDLKQRILITEEKFDMLESDLKKLEQHTVDLAKQREELTLNLKNSEARANDLSVKLSITESKLLDKTTYTEFLELQNKKGEKDFLDLRNEYGILFDKSVETEKQLSESESEKRSLNIHLSAQIEKFMVSEMKSRALESTILEMRSRIEELENNVAVAVEKAISSERRKLETAERLLEDEKVSHFETRKKELQVSKQLSETQFILTEEQKRTFRMTELVETLESRLQVYQKQREEAETVASANYLRSKNLSTELAYSTEKAELAEQILTKVRKDTRTRAISSSLAHANTATYIYPF